MCGIAGYVGASDPALNDSLISSIASRGPDARGHADRGIVQLLSTRLAIQDLSDAGSQPMTCERGDVAIVYNGELYNYEEILDLLRARHVRMRGHSDTELILRAFLILDTEVFARLRGMFAIAIHDRRDGRLILVRDQLGIKPLYVRREQRFSFASSARALANSSAPSPALNLSAVGEFLRFRHVRSSQTLWMGIDALPPGTMLIRSGNRETSSRYWAPPLDIEPLRCSRDELAEQLSELLDRVVTENLRSDVPLAMLLSGGVDSGTVLEAAVSSGIRPHAFTYAMDAYHDESGAARACAARLGCEFTVVRGQPPSASHYVRALYDAIATMDVPVGDSILVPTHQLLREVARSHKVALTGEGADELFGGYAHVRPLLRLGRLARVPGIASLLPSMVRMLPIGLLARQIQYDAAMGAEEKAQMLHVARVAKEPSRALDAATSIFNEADLQPELAPLAPDVDPALSSDSLDLRVLLNHGLRTWLPNQILNKMDQLSMAHGLEARVPFVDPRLVEFVARIPRHHLVRGSSDKAMLRSAAGRRNPAWLAGRKQAFFQASTTSHRANLEGVASEWLSASTLRRFGVLSIPVVRTAVDAMRRGSILGEKRVIAMASLHMWLDRNR